MKSKPNKSMTRRERVLPFGTPADVKRVTQETIKVLGEDGGYIIGPTHAIPGDTPPENIVALQKTTDAFGLRVETCWEQSL